MSCITITLLAFILLCCIFGSFAQCPASCTVEIGRCRNSLSQVDCTNAAQCHRASMTCATNNLPPPATRVSTRSAGESTAACRGTCSAPIRNGTVTANGIVFSYLEAGPSNGRLVLCLHGFPDSPHSFSELLTVLGGAGYRAVAPYMRGYFPTGFAPAGQDYQTGWLVRDANALRVALGGGSNSILIGHDWGASAAYGAASVDPTNWAKVVTLAMPPGPAFGLSAFTNVVQTQAVWYFFALGYPLYPLFVFADGSGSAFVQSLWNDWTTQGTIGLSSVIAKALEALTTDPANLDAAIQYYRNSLWQAAAPNTVDFENYAASFLYPSQPVLFIGGRNDPTVLFSSMQLSQSIALASNITNVQYAFYPACGHWPHLERVTVVNQKILAFLNA